MSGSHVRMCLSPGDDPTDKTCRTTTGGGLTRTVTDAGATSWVLRLIGTDLGVMPVATMTLDFNANSGNVTLDSFRFQGTDAAAYNGFVAEVGAIGGGDLQLDATLDLGTRATAVNPPLRGCMSVPIAAGSSLVAVLSLYADSADAFTGDQRRLVQMVAPHLAGAIQSACHGRGDQQSVPGERGAGGRELRLVSTR